MREKGVRPDIGSIREEVERASQVYYHTPLQLGIDNKTKAFVVERCQPFIAGKNILELGYVDGLWTQKLVERGLCVDVVEGASSHVAHARKTFSNQEQVRVFHELFQEFKPDCKYDSIIAGDMIRYLDDPESFLLEARTWLNSNGNLIVTVPNSRSLHRRIGSLMRIQATPMSTNERDLAVGNRKSYDRYELKDLLLKAGYQILELRGCFLKPLSSEQMSGWDDTLLQAFLEIGNELEDYCWFLYAIAQPSTEMS